MIPNKVVIVGGVAGGATALARLRRLNEDMEIVLFEKDEYISFANCGLPYYIGGVITDRDQLLVQTVEGMKKRFKADIRNFSLVTRIHRDRKTVEVKNVQTNEVYEESYDILVLSPGAKPIIPPIEGLSEMENAFVVRNIPDTDKIYAYIEEHNVRHTTVVGGGFIGVEMTENLRERGIEVTLIDAGQQIMNPIDLELANILHREMREHNVELILEDSVAQFKNNGKTVVLESEKHIETDMVILAIGIRPEMELAREAGLLLGARGIRVNEKLQTSDESIYAIGDAIEVQHYITKEYMNIPLAWPANRQGRVVADIISGRDVKYHGTLGTNVAKVFNYTVASTGLNEKQLRKSDITFHMINVHANNHAGYYPGAVPVHLKVLFEEGSGRILGAQGVGKSGVEKRIDVIATAIKGNLTVMDLQDLELSYAPPYSSAKDPVNQVGYVAEQLMIDGVRQVYWQDLEAARMDASIQIIDTRRQDEYEQGNIKEALLIPVDELRDRLSEIPKDKVIYLHCQSGVRSYISYRILTHAGFTVYNVSGGYTTYANGIYTV